MKCFIGGKCCLAALLIAGGAGLFAGNAESSRLAMQAVKEGKEGNWRDAANLYDEAYFEAEDPQLKLNSLTGEAEAWKNAGMLYKEFEVLEKIMTRFPAQCDIAVLTDREYKIAKKFSTGYRDPAFWHLRFIPWLTDEDRMAEVGEKVLNRAPFASQAADLRLRMALYYDREGKAGESIRHLRILVKDYPDAPEYKNALLGLAEMLFFCSKRGDGDGKLNQEAVAYFEEFKKRYPDATEMPYVERCILEGKDIQSKRLLGIARFYSRTGRKDAAQQYLNTVLRDYPDSESAEDSEKLLVKLDKEYVPDDFLPEVKERIPRSPRREMPDENKVLLIAPENSGGKYLLPVYDIKGDKKAENGQ